MAFTYTPVAIDGGVEIVWQCNETGEITRDKAAHALFNQNLSGNAAAGASKIDDTIDDPWGGMSPVSQGGAGTQGPPGQTGATGATGSAVFLEASGGDEEPLFHPGITGSSGSPGATGAPGPTGPAVFLEAPGADEEVLFHPGIQGSSGSPGVPGAQGVAGPALFLVQGEEQETNEAVSYGPTTTPNVVPAGIGWVGGRLTSITTIAATTTPTTGGVTYAAPPILAGQVYRVRARGQFVAVSSATVRGAQISAFWGSTQLTGLAYGTILASTARTTPFSHEIILVGVDTTHIWSDGYNLNQWIAAAPTEQRGAAPTSVVVTAGPQTLDLRFSMSVVAAGDSWNIWMVTMERLV